MEDGCSDVEKLPRSPSPDRWRGVQRALACMRQVSPKHWAPRTSTTWIVAPKRLEIAGELGANPVKFKTSDRWFRRGQPPGSEKPLISVDASASVSGLQYAIRSLAPGGRCTSVCFYFRKGTPVPLFQMYLNSSTLHLGVSHPRAVLPEVLELIAKGNFRPEFVTTLQADWEDAPEAYLERTTKVILTRKATDRPISMRLKDNSRIDPK